MYTINENDGILQNPLATTKSRTHQDRAHPQQRTGNIIFFECNLHDDFCQFSLIGRRRRRPAVPATISQWALRLYSTLVS